MKTSIIIISLFIVSFSLTFGQSAVTDSITVKRVFGGYQFIQGEKRLTMHQLVNAMETNELALQQIKSAQSSHNLATIVGAVGGFMVGWPIGAALGGGEPNWTMAGIGAGLIVVSIPITQSTNKKTIQAIETYNSGLQTSSFWDNKELKLAISEGGVGFILRF
ncbi:hypothetical protein [Alkalitalea saponilacus]|uniref:Glycine zipper family protein n=1 Tax=Alkalitalea saponilacus TaxID=889453 RepID=A0A1T5DYG2_9BACT|nr:hypothetical protein [Alkalitalea saponilacus]ASB49151.1 hypothetical protein CDL62_08350 [Alkalitalea saponilacus]SKB76600.1 hypothetical protein SAMN03080601_01162 [Alkalitalea saponilacus]